MSTLFCAWLLVAGCLLKGVKSSGRVVYFTSLFPYIVLVILAIRGFSLPGAWIGIQAYVTPKWEMLIEPEIWVDAATQIIFSLGPACGCVITLSSYNQFKRNCHLDAILIAISNCVTSMFCGLVVFSILGFMAYDANVDVQKVSIIGKTFLWTCYITFFVLHLSNNTLPFYLNLGSQRRSWTCFHSVSGGLYKDGWIRFLFGNIFPDANNARVGVNLWSI